MSVLASKLLGLISGGGRTLGVLGGARTLISGANDSVFNHPGKNKFRQTRSKVNRPFKKKGGFGPEAFKGKKGQHPDNWDGFGPYIITGHMLPNHKCNKDNHRRQQLKKHAQERNLINTIRKADILPKEIRALADKEIHTIPRDSAITRVNRRCTVTGRARGIFHQYRVSRFVFRANADYNKISGVMLAHWQYNTDIKP